MASITPNKNKAGEITSYRWRACLKRDDLGKQKFASKTVPAPKDLTPGKALKQMQHEADQWEKGMRDGIVPVDSKSFEHFINEVWWPAHVMDGEHKQSSIEFYKQLTKRLIDRLGHKNLNDIKAIDIQKFLNWLRTDAKQEKPGSSSRYFLNRLGAKTPDEITDTAGFIEAANKAKAKGQKWYLKFAGWYKKPLEEITCDDLRRYAERLQVEDAKPTDKPLSPTTIRHYYKLLGVLFSFAEKHDLIERNPMTRIDPPKMDHHDVDFLDPEQAQAFIKALDGAPVRWKVMMNLLIGTGIRRGEALGLQWQDINLKAATISICRNVTHVGGGAVIDTPKSSRSIRTLPITPRLVTLLKEWQSEQMAEWQKLNADKKITRLLAPKAFVFGSETDPYEPMFPTTPTRWLKQFMKSHDLPDVSPHDLRHTCGSLLIMSGASVKDVQDTLGHADPATTLRFYAGNTPESLRKAADGLAEMLGE